MMEAMGNAKFLKLYIMGALVSAIAFLLEKYTRTALSKTRLEKMRNRLSSAVGASGAISAVFTAFALMFPAAQLRMFFFIPGSARSILMFTVAFEVFRMLFQPDSTIAASGHLGGAAAGAMAFALMKRGRF